MLQNKARLSTICAIIPFISIAFSVPAGSAEVFFTPSNDCENKISEAINASKAEIVASVYSINNDKIAKTLIAAHKRGVRVRVLTDATQAAGRSSRVLELKQAGIDLRLHSKHKIEHNKFGWFDGKLAINGSFNWTNPASQVNSENCVVFSAKEANIISAFKERFEELWKLNSREKSDSKIANIARKRTMRVPANSHNPKKLGIIF